MNHKKAAYIKKVFNAMVIQNTQKLNRGLERRRAMQDKMDESDEVIVNTRTRWIRKSASAVIEVLRNSAIEFNAENDDDRISTLDLVDVLETARGLIKGEID